MLGKAARRFKGIEMHLNPHHFAVWLRPGPLQFPTMELTLCIFKIGPVRLHVSSCTPMGCVEVSCIPHLALRVCLGLADVSSEGGWLQNGNSDRCLYSQLLGCLLY